jgi:hypothetical protein
MCESRRSSAAASDSGSSQFHEMADPALRSILAYDENWVESVKTTMKVKPAIWCLIGFTGELTIISIIPSFTFTHIYTKRAHLH